MLQIRFSDQDLAQIRARGMRVEEVLSQMERFKTGFPYVNLKSPCTVGDGINALAESELDPLGNHYKEAALEGRAMKFVPASGAATRMFKLLLSYQERYERMEQGDRGAEGDDPNHAAFLQFFRGLKQFAFYGELKEAMARDGLDTESLVAAGQYGPVLTYLLTPKGLDLAHLPKGLIKFHTYPEAPRTPFEEHLVEAKGYVMDKKGRVRVHFTVSQEHEQSIRDHVEALRGRYEGPGIRFEVSFSLQKPSTDTLAADLQNRPFRDEQGRLVFRPGGHGALLENLNDLKGDLVFVKNIDNVVPDRLKEETFRYKKALGGYLLGLQKEIFAYLQALSDPNMDKGPIEEIMEFVRDQLCVIPPQSVQRGPKEAKRDYLISRLNRPLRVCGMVKNEGEPGGGPFWVQSLEDGSGSIQIVESSQVDMTSPAQRRIWESSTHFNPVDLVCGVRDFLGSPFDLMKFRDPDTGFISIKSKGGRELKALELPGLWNGSMAHWNTVFVEVPIITFNPVKTVLDLLRENHQPQG